MPGDWLIKLPPAITTRHAAAIGTAGFAAMLCVMALERGGLSGGDVLVRGAAGGVGSVAIAILAARGFRVAASTCGLAQGLDLTGSVAPFILRGVTLAGVDTVNAPMALREHAWRRLATDLDPGLLEQMTTMIGLDEVSERAKQVLKGGVRGRTLVDLST